MYFYSAGPNYFAVAPIFVQQPQAMRTRVHITNSLVLDITPERRKRWAFKGVYLAISFCVLV